MSSPPSTPTIDAAVNRIRAWRRANGLSPSRLAAEAGLSEMTTRRIDDDWKPNLETLRKLEGLIPADWQEGEAAASTASAADSESQGAS